MSDHKPNPSPRREPEPAGPDTDSLQPQITPVVFGPFPEGIPAGLAVQQVQVWQGQFPPPDAIERYEAVLPGAFDRIVTMAERQQSAVISSTAETREFMQRDTRRGTWLGWSVTATAIGAAVYCASIDQVVVAVALIAVPVMSVAKALIDSSRSSVRSQSQAAVIQPDTATHTPSASEPPE